MKILDFGSLNLDHVYSVDNFVRPGETISSLKMEDFCGGKGLNQSIALARAGAEVYHAGCIGKDGQVLADRLKEAGVNTKFVKVLDCPTGHAIIQINAKGQNCIILYGGANQEITEDFAKEVIDQFSKGDLILLQNEINNLPFIMNYAYEKGLQIALNPSPLNDKLLACPLDKVAYFIMNEIEGSEIVGGEEDPDKVIEKMKEKFPNAKVVLTLGKDGAKYFDGEKVYFHGIYDVKRVDSTAAGDTFTGYFLACIGEGLSPEVALEKASKASSLAVHIKGASNSIPTRAEVDTTDIKLDPRFL